MEPVSAQLEERSRKNNSLILKKMMSIGQARLASLLGLHESTISKIKGEDVERWAKMLAYMGLKVVPVEKQCFSVHQINAILTLAKAHMEAMNSADQLSFEDE